MSLSENSHLKPPGRCPLSTPYSQKLPAAARGKNHCGNSRSSTPQPPRSINGQPSEAPSPSAFFGTSSVLFTLPFSKRPTNTLKWMHFVLTVGSFLLTVELFQFQLCLGVSDLQVDLLTCNWSFCLECEHASNKHLNGLNAKEAQLL